MADYEYKYDIQIGMNQSPTKVSSIEDNTRVKLYFGGLGNSYDSYDSMFGQIFKNLNQTAFLDSF